MFVLQLKFVLASLVSLSSTLSTAGQNQESNPEQNSPHHGLIYDRNSSLDSPRMLCVNSSYRGTEIRCSKDGPLLLVGYCATFDEGTELLSITKCLAFKSDVYNVTTPGYINLPRNLSQLNDYMCGPLNRQGLVCSQCADGYGPSFTSFGYRCVNCSDTWYSVPLFLLLEFGPITIFYLIILVFQISVTSAPVPCFIMYAQFIIIALYVGAFSDGDGTLCQVMFSESGDIRWDMKIIQTVHGIFNLDFFELILPVFCVSSRLRSIHFAFFGYISVIYPLFLVFLTWVCVELHGRNCRLIVLLSKPFHSCLVRLRRKWDPKSDIIDTFTTLFFLSYNKNIYQILTLVTMVIFTSYNEAGDHVKVDTLLGFDTSIKFGSKYHLAFLIPSVLFFTVYSVLPTLLLTFYPFRFFRSCLSRCHLDFPSVHTFIERIYHCYRNGLDGGRDLRIFSGLYFFVRKASLLVALFSYKFLQVHPRSIKVIWFPSGTLFLIIAFFIVLIRPYQKAYMNYVDTLILSYLSLLCFALASELSTTVIVRTMLFIPITVFVLAIVSSKVWKTYQVRIRRFSWAASNCCCECFLIKQIRSTIVTFGASTSDENDSEHLPITRGDRNGRIAVAISYGSCNGLVPYT